MVFVQIQLRRLSIQSIWLYIILEHAATSRQSEKPTVSRFFLRNFCIGSGTENGFGNSPGLRSSIALTSPYRVPTESLSDAGHTTCGTGSSGSSLCPRKRVKGRLFPPIPRVYK